jgi:hypothetical protein
MVRCMMTIAVLFLVIFITVSFAILLELEDLEYNKQAVGDAQSMPTKGSFSLRNWDFWFCVCFCYKNATSVIHSA